MLARSQSVMHRASRVWLPSLHAAFSDGTVEAARFRAPFSMTTLSGVPLERDLPRRANQDAAVGPATNSAQIGHHEIRNDAVGRAFPR